MTNDQNLTDSSSRSKADNYVQQLCILWETHEISNIDSAYHKDYFQMWREVRFDPWGPLEVKSKMAIWNQRV